jgi:phenylalanyl-tRNA synthetase beta chain
MPAFHISFIAIHQLNRDRYPDLYPLSLHVKISSPMIPLSFRYSSGIHKHFLIPSGHLHPPTMTVVSFEYSDIIDLLGKRFSIDDIRAKTSMIGGADEGIEGEKLSFDISPNRPDMYSVEGLVRALKGVLDIEKGLPRFDVHESDIRFIVEKSVEEIRPHAVGGLVRGIEMTDELVKSLMDLQEKLHMTIGRRRKKIAIGIHDIDKVTPPFKYRAVKPDSVRFAPLGLADELTLLEILQKHEKGREFAHILMNKPLFPIIEDANGTVLSFPPIINGTASTLTEDTRNLFIDVTGLEFGAVNAALNIISTSLSERGGRIETIALELPEGRTRTPDLDAKVKKVSTASANKLLGLSLTPQEAAGCLEKMRCGTRLSGDLIEVQIPAYRTDILHEVDLIEDIGVGHGYDRIPIGLPRDSTIGAPAQIAIFAQTLREMMIGYGYQEIMSLSMVDPQMPFKGGADGPRILNPVSSELSGLRSSLLPSLLRILAMNTHRDLPQRVFEVEDVLAGAMNVRHLAGASIHVKASFTEVKSMVQSIMRDLGCEFDLETSSDSNFIPGRCAAVMVSGKKAGLFGEIAPAVLEAHSLAHPVAAFELNAAVLRERR